MEDQLKRKVLGLSKKSLVIAICYDFDGTLSPGNMQEYGFFSSLGKVAKNFWSESESLARGSQADPILCYMKHMIEKAKDKKIPTTQSALRDYGKDVQFFPGVVNWFDRVNSYARERAVKIEHYIVSSGLKEIIEGSKIGKNFKKIYACSFIYDNNGGAEWPAVAVNYTTKTQFIFRINKGIEDDADNKAINKYTPENQRRIPFAHMIYIGDGATDVPCMKLVKEKGGTSIAVFGPRKKKMAMQLLCENRVNFAIAADYSEGALMEKTIQALIDRIVAENRVAALAKSKSIKNRAKGVKLADTKIQPDDSSGASDDAK